MSGVSIMGRQVGGACRAGRVIGLSHSGTRLVLPNPADNLIVNGGVEQGRAGGAGFWLQVRTGWTAIGDGSVVTSSSANSAVHDPHGGLAWYMSRSDGGGVSQTLAVSPGSRYRLDFWHAVGDGSSWRRVTATVTAGDAVVASTKTPIRADTQWYEVTLDFTAPKDCTAVTVTITENTWLRVDDVSLVEII